MGGNMIQDRKFETLSKNYDELEDDRKDTLLSIGEKLLSIQNLVNNKKVSENKIENIELKGDIR